MRLLFGTNNKGKLKEINAIVGNSIGIISPIDLSLNINILEDGKTLKENAMKKAETYRRISDICSIGEDTGLEVDSLEGSPGIYSARYSGSSEKENRKKLLNELTGITNRRAVFRTVVALSFAKGWVECFDGVVKGKIAQKERGNNGFGYDSVFIPDGFSKTFGEMDEEKKNSISHRKKALEKAINFVINRKNRLEKMCK